MSKLATAIWKRVYKIDDQAIEEKERLRDYVMMVTDGIPRNQRKTRGRIENGKPRAKAEWFQRYI